MLSKINTLSIPATILIASLILGGFYYASEINKQNSIEKQQAVKLEEEQKAAEANLAAESFSNNLKCQGLLKDLKSRWYNVVGIYYSDWQNTCIVKYTKDGETQEAPLERMQDAED